ncbi:hypothetical protein [Streptomyces silvisoli]|uniref:Uncharacterized protein n=1 Tax=Streptomyces silvisoli TaxID=3034235 RepID=A0ABT5ZP85_9ACTN|nr:hypothetical protein [Streptomyces silvisoli]MDF3291632.1 hypothetical protein [Streptomyces silvisoli]
MHGTVNSCEHPGDNSYQYRHSGGQEKRSPHWFPLQVVKRQATDHSGRLAADRTNGYSFRAEPPFTLRSRAAVVALGTANMAIGLTVLGKRRKLVRAMLRNSRTRRLIALALSGARLGAHHGAGSAAVVGR